MLASGLGNRIPQDKARLLGNWSLVRKHGGDRLRESKGNIEMFQPQLHELPRGRLLREHLRGAGI